ncbi:MAG: dienelactone hydrolase [Bacteroidota bacterium]
MSIQTALKTGILLFLFASCGLMENDQPISHKEFLRTHKYSIGQTRLELLDSIRERPIKTELWYPTADTTKVNIATEYPFQLAPTAQDADLLPGKFPLVLLSHGTGGNRISQMWLASELVGNGYLVAAVDHYGNTLDNKIPENFVRIWERPLDIRFLLDHLLADEKWGPKIDTSQIAMAGFSLGGYTTIALAGGQIDYQALKAFSETAEGKMEFTLPELGDISPLITPEIIKDGNERFNKLKDGRITTFVAMAPALGQGFNRTAQFANIQSPLLLIGAQNDRRTPVVNNAQHYKKLIPSATYIELEGKVGHYIFMNEAKGGLKRSAPIIFKDDPSVNRKEVHQKVARKVLRFFEENLK